MSTISERIQQLRRSTGMGRTLFARHVGIKEGTLKSIERDGKQPGAEILSAITTKYPQHIVWILTGSTDAKAGHISPEIEEEVTNLGVGSPATGSRKK